ncbi:DALR domain-containing protein, partial [Arthrospira platensis SPKY1]|nr:DALR domain-containing protein [Arthrospira platensis SPKY1]
PLDQPSNEGRLLRKALQAMHEELCNDFNSAKSLAVIFDLVTRINVFHDNPAQLRDVDQESFQALQVELPRFVQDVLGLIDEQASNTQHLDAALSVLIDIRKEARIHRDFATADRIRIALQEAGIRLKDGKDGTTYELE